MSAHSKPYAALLLDFGCVIAKSIFEIVEPFERGLGLAPGTLKWRGPLDLDTDPLWRAMMASELTERQYWERRSQEIATLIGEEWTPLELMTRASDVVGAAQFRPEMAELAEDAKAAGIRVGVLTNELELFHGRAWMDTVPALKFVDAIVDATHTKILKPDPRAYALGVAAVGATPETTLFVDDQKHNVEGGRAAGLGVIHFDIRQPALVTQEIRRRLALPQ
jgi:putative hydrolase of the HAD superfamily